MSRFGWSGLVFAWLTVPLGAQAPITLGTPQSATRPAIVRGQNSEFVPAVRLAPPEAASRPTPPSPANTFAADWGAASPAQYRQQEEAYNSGAVTKRPPPPVAPPVAPASSANDPLHLFQDQPATGSASYFGKLFGGEHWGGGKWCGSDTEFCGLVSPVTNPFLFEDPRSLTEIRPIFTAQSVPGRTPGLNGGHIETLGVQARLALTNKLSFMINRLGGIWVNPGSGSPFEGGSGLSELNLGAKYTFLRSPDTGTIMAAGAMFQIPVGPSKVFQDTGTASVVPFASFGQTLRFAQLGNFNFIDTIGYSQPIDSQRSAFFYNSFHVDYDVFGNNHWFPLVEVNWFRYTESGAARTIGIEGTDLINFGDTTISGRDYLTLAAGLRYKFNENMILGSAIELPISRPKDTTDYRFTVDFIFRY
jgi:hypothetical protein